MNTFEQLERSIGYNFQDKNLLEEALTHSSYSNEYKKQRNKDNERLEFLGDSILGLIISNFLFKKCKNLPEGELTKIRAAIVCEKTLKDIARDLSLGDFLFLGKGEESTGGRNRDSILADAVEALIAAIYLDGGFEKATDFVLEKMTKKIEDGVSGKIRKDYKTSLQEMIQKENKEPITYQLESEQGPDHSKTFVMRVHLGDIAIGVGTGKSKKEAEQNAAKNALEKL